MVAGTLGTLAPLGALTTLVAGCSGDGSGTDAAQNTGEDKRLRREATKQSLELLARYDATADSHSGLADRLRPLRAATMRHAEVLSGDHDGKSGKNTDGRGGNGDRSGRDGAGEAGAGKNGRPGRPRVPGDEKAALTELGDAERRTARARTEALVKAPPETARLLASLAAAGAAHAYLLGAGDGKDGGS
ncbi:hypothetical protein [Streptomyces sp. WMMB 322]|uniref:hypothetical protein n=1 Tax=Streptomyces sp. WMMB 322 TaxID=1286821 RepID=UPI0006E1A7C7|nr:hypothetical protein [Streptomyces sp. WMMB 322]SCK33271.1 hypothetical protein H180DRAFT_02690 [Streptomyces sp. WMMB 322]